MNSKSKWVALFFVILILLVAAILPRFAKKPIIYFSGAVKFSEEIPLDDLLAKDLFIVLYPKGVTSGMPYGAFRVKLSLEEAQKREKDFVISEKNLIVMDQNIQAAPTSYRVKVRLGFDGQSAAQKEGDIFTELDDVLMGSENVTLTLTIKKES